MEIDHPAGDDVSDEERSGGRSSKARSYDCIFCKRGFSNAQALGGHMNIHRKDRAKLRHPPSCTQLVFDSHDMVLQSYPPPEASHYAPQFTLEGDARGCNLRWPWVPAVKRDGVMNSTREGPGQLSAGQPDFVHAHRINGEGRPSWEPEGEDLDLELRLGPERRPDSSSGFKEYV